MKFFRLLPFVLCLLTSCESIDCTLNNVVMLTIGFHASDGSDIKLSDTLTVTAMGTDSVLYNRAIGRSSISLPMSFYEKADTLNLSFQPREGEPRTVVLYVEKSNTPHFESPDCPATMFHQLLNVGMMDISSYTDSVVIVNKDVEYGSQEHIRVYLHAAD